MYFDKYYNKKSEAEIYKDIRDILSDLKNTSSKTRFELLSNDLYNLYNLANFYNLYNYPLVENYISRSTNPFISDTRFYFLNKNLSNFINTINSDYDYHLAISNLSNKFIDNDFIKSYRELDRIADYHKTEEVAEQFMHDFDQRIYQAYLEIKNKEHILIEEANGCDIGGTFYWLNFNRVPYIALFLNNNIDDAVALAHESAHARQFKILKNNLSCSNNTYLFREVYSFYTQFVMYKYLEDNKIYSEDAKACFNSTLDYLNCCLINYHDVLEILDEGVYDEGDITQLKNNTFYCYGILIALKYFDMYQHDPEQTKYLVDQFLEQSYKMKPLDVLNNFGLNAGEIRSGHVLKKYIKKTKADY